MTTAGGRLATARRLVRLAISVEGRMWVSLYRWLRRSPAGEPGSTAFGYARRVTPILVVFIVLSALEIPILDLVLPWRVARLISVVLGAYGVIWMVGLLAMIRVNPHLVTESGLRVRGGGGIDVTIPWDYIASIQANNRGLHGRDTQIDRAGGEAILCVGVVKETNVDIAFRHPTLLELPKGDTEPLAGLRIAVDEPVALVSLVREHLSLSRTVA